MNQNLLKLYRMAWFTVLCIAAPIGIMAVVYRSSHMMLAFWGLFAVYMVLSYYIHTLKFGGAE